ncbi:MAG TPA: DUF4252 domain-containing protein [Bacteroidales bacterium]|nr:DUF4252 domain-containing protein [Bacteroidales bacterium]
MKTGLCTIAFLFMTVLAESQTNPIDQMFDKYSEREGFTLVTISSRMFSMIADLSGIEENADNIIHNLRSIKILAVSDSLLNNGINFYSELMKKLDKNAYEELMVVKEGPDITKFLVKYNGERIAELLVISGGPGGNSLISIKGNLSLKNISDLSKSMDIGELDKLENVDKKKP